MAMDYQNALAGLASGMAGKMGGGEGEDQGEMSNEFYPCPLCGGSGMVSEQMLEGGGMGAMPPRLTARAPMMGAGGPMMGGGRPPMMPSVPMGS